MPPKKQSSLLSFFGAPKEKKQQYTAPTHMEVDEVSEVSEVDKVSAVAKVPEVPEVAEINEAVEVTEVASFSPLKEERTRKRFNYAESESDSEIASPVIRNPFAAGKKRKLKRRIDISDDESDQDYNPVETKDSDDEFNEGFDSDALNSLMTEIESEKPVMTPLSERFMKISVEKSASPSSSSSISPSGKYEKPSSNILSRFNAINQDKSVELTSSSKMTTKQAQRQDREHKFKEKNTGRYGWLQDQKDLQGNPVGSPEYDPRTLFIPKSAWNIFTPFERQYWEVKHKFWDTIVFFKKGKFYELYEKDADIGHKDFDLKMTDRVNMRMVGVPEMSFDYWTAQFIAKGHKVAKVDQMETAIGKSMREKGDASTSKADKIIRRELTSVLTAGTLVDAGLLTNDLGTYCMSIKELCGDETMPPTFGICFVDTATAEFNLVHFQDDINRTKFETLIMQIKPKELVTEKGRLSKTTTRLLKSILNEPLWNMLIPEVEFWDSRVTQDELDCNRYWNEVEEKSREPLLHAMTEARNDPVLMSAFGGLIWYLRSLKLDRELLSAKNIKMYDPIRNATSLVLDGQTLSNLEIFQNSYNGSIEGTVFKLLANSVTPFGKRLFKSWLCHPLRKVQDINDRLDAIEDFMQLGELHATVSKQLASLPDLERLISRIHSGRIQVKQFLEALKGFGITCEIIKTMTENRSQYQSKLLGRLIDHFPHIYDKLQEIQNSYIIADVDVDYQKANTMIPVEGQNREWDALNEKIDALTKKFDNHLKDIKVQLGNSRIAYKDINKDVYQIEVPKAVKVPNDWIKISNTTAFNRYYDSKVKSFVAEYKELKETKNAFVKKFSLEIYANFDESYAMWLNAVKNIAELDALMGLAKGSMQIGEPACRPQLIDQEKSVLEFEELRHPCIVPGVATDFIPNDVALGGEQPSVIVLTGPNMGGKSTLLRQTCVAIIMAQLGGYVPAKSCRLTPCDRIYTRIGANDNIMGGQSTFMVELAETSKILKEATNKSMVILDELGRGTSTFDGYAIAYSVLHHISTHIGCLAMFATHYQTLCKEFTRNPEINNMHMGYIMDEDKHDITFLYKLTPGICFDSFGMNVARMAGIPNTIVQRAADIAKEVEISHKSKDTSYAMDIDGETKINITPAVIADVKYIMTTKKRDTIATERIIESFKRLLV